MKSPTMKLMMGYGLVDLRSNHQHLNDSRINQKSFLHDADNYDISEFQQYVKEYARKTNPCPTDVFIYLNYIKNQHTISDCVVYDAKNGMESVLCIIPPTELLSWIRVDNAIDMVLAEKRIISVSTDDVQAPWVKTHAFPLYPYDQWFDVKTNRLLKKGTEDLAIIGLYQQVHQEIHSSLYKNEVMCLPRKYQEALGVTSVRELQKRYIPQIPKIVELLVNYTKLFTSEDTVMELRPILYCYWS